MLRWNTVADKTIFDMTVKMYRDPFKGSNTITSIFNDIEFDHHAYKYYKSELYMYRILDENFESLIEERGDTSRIKKIYIPVDQDVTISVL